MWKRKGLKLFGGFDKKKKKKTGFDSLKSLAQTKRKGDQQ